MSAQVSSGIVVCPACGSSDVNVFERGWERHGKCNECNECPTCWDSASRTTSGDGGCQARYAMTADRAEKAEPERRRRWLIDNPSDHEMHEWLKLHAQDTDGPCASCGRPCEVWFAPNDIWNAVVGGYSGLRCVACFIREAEAAGFDKRAWLVQPEPKGHNADEHE